MNERLISGSVSFGIRYLTLPRKLRTVAFSALLAVGGCGLLGSDEPEAPVEACPREDLPARNLVGAFLRQPEGVGLFEVLAVEGRASRSGAVRRLWLDDYTFKARADDDGGLDGSRGARAEPIPGLAISAAGASAFTVGYRLDGTAYTGRLAIGTPTPGSRLPSNGQVRYQGPVQLTVQGAPPALPVEVTGTAVLDVGFGSRQVSMTVSTPSGALPFSRIDWTGIGMCGPRLCSTGQGGFRTAGPDGRAVSFVGSGGGAPGGSAMVNATCTASRSRRRTPRRHLRRLLIQRDSAPSPESSPSVPNPDPSRTRPACFAGPKPAKYL